MEKVHDYLKKMNGTILDGKTIVPEMKKNDYPGGRHPQWHSYYLKKAFEDFLETLGGRSEVFGKQTKVKVYNELPTIMRLHSSHTKNNSVPTNDLYAVNDMLKKYGEINYFIVHHNSEIDYDGMFREWQQDLYDGKTSYEIKKDCQGRKRKEYAKRAIKITGYELVKINISNIHNHSTKFQNGFINSNDIRRNSKLSIKLGR